MGRPTNSGGNRVTVPSVAATPFRFVENAHRDRDAVPPRHALTVAHTQAAAREIATWPGYQSTPLVRLDGLARTSTVGRIWYKDEGHRFGVRSFKPLGGGYAVSRLLARVVGREVQRPEVTSRELLNGEFDARLADVTVTCATDGNHGRAVAWAAQLFGCRAVVFLASHVTSSRERAIASFGADVVRTDGNHDDAVREAARAASRDGWFLISQMRSATEPQIALDILDGYSTLFEETRRAIPDETPTHIFVQAGVGGLAAAACAHADSHGREARPQVVVVEAARADCVFRSLVAGRRVTVHGDLDTVMAGLAAGEVSEYAWPYLVAGADAAMAIDDAAAVATMRLLAEPPWGDPVVQGGESGVASLAAALVAAQSDETRTRLDLTDTSRILCVGTEGVTDPEVYDRLVGPGGAAGGS